MTEIRATADLSDLLVAFVRDKLLPDEVKEGFTADTPLLELGVIDSLNAARLLNYIRRELGTVVPTSMIGTENFRDVRSITAMVSSLALSSGGAR